MRKFDILTIGDINVDIILKGMAAHPTVGKEILCDSMELAIGGSATIFAINASSIGSEVAFMGMVGLDAYGSFMVEGLAARGVDTRAIIRSDRFATGATVALNYNEDRASVTYPGSMAEMGLADLDLSMLSTAKHLHLSSIFLQGNLFGEVSELLRLAKSAGMTTSLDPQWDPGEVWDLDLESTLPLVDVFLPNEVELLNLTRTSSVDDALRKIGRCAHVVVVKRGAAGSLLWEKGNRVELPAFLNRQIVDAIGAGDSFDAGFIHQFVRGFPLNQCQRLGNLAGAVSTTEVGGTEAIQDLETMLRIGRDRFSYEVVEV